MMRPDVFEEEYGVALLPMQENQSSSCGDGEVSWFFSSCGRRLGFPLELRWGWPLITRVFSATSGLLANCERHLGILLEAWQGDRDASRGEAGDPVSLCSCHRDIGIPIDFQEESGIVSFGSTELSDPLKLPNCVRPPVEMR